MALAARAVRATRWLRLPRAGQIGFGVAWLLSVVVLLICATTGVNTWDTCVAGNDSGLEYSLLSLFGAFVALLVAVVLSFWKSSTLSQRLTVLGFGLVTVGVIAAAWWVISAHPGYSCDPGG